MTDSLISTCWQAALPWPLAVIDFEASSLDQDSYPIEVGLALWSAPDAPILGWSSLIRPASCWIRKGHWSIASAKVHGILGRDLTAHGQSPSWIAAALNTAIAPGGVAWCDGGPYDTHWARALFKAAGVAPLFVLDDWHRLAAKLGKKAFERAVVRLEQEPSRHRARPDAEQLMLALASAVGADPGSVQDADRHIPALRSS